MMLLLFSVSFCLMNNVGFGVMLVMAVVVLPIGMIAVGKLSVQVCLKLMIPSSCVNNSICVTYPEIQLVGFGIICYADVHSCNVIKLS